MLVTFLLTRLFFRATRGQLFLTVNRNMNRSSGRENALLLLESML